MGIDKEKNGSKIIGVASDGISNVLNKTTADMTPLMLSDEYKTKLILVRHGESLGNAVRAFLGHTNVDLSPRGYQQAERTAELLSQVHIDKIYASDLLRAFNTGVKVAERHNLFVEPVRALRELYLGDWEGKSVASLEEEFPSLMHIWKTDFGRMVCPGGESAVELRERIYDAVLSIAKQNCGKTVVIAFHGAAIRMLWSKICGISLDKVGSETTFAYNASISLAYYDGENLIPGEYSHMAHLTDI